jgi:hypothetical protein
VTSVIFVQRIAGEGEKRDATFWIARRGRTFRGIDGNSHQFEERTGASAHMTLLASFLAGMCCVRAEGWLDGRTDADAFDRNGQPERSS